MASPFAFVSFCLLKGYAAFFTFSTPSDYTSKVIYIWLVVQFRPRFYERNGFFKPLNSIREVFMNHIYIFRFIRKFLRNQITLTVIPLLSAIMVCIQFTPAFSSDFTGIWSGTAWSDYGGSLSVSGNLTQTGTSLTGTMSLATDGCLANLPVTGSASGNVASFQCSTTCFLNGSYVYLEF